MKHLVSFLLTAFFIVSLSIAAHAQASNKSGKTSGDSPSVTDEPKITSKYDKEKDQTTIEFSMMEVANTEPQNILVSASFIFPGTKLRSQPEDIIFILSITSPGGYKYSDIMAMKIMADGQKLPDVTMLNLDKRRLKTDYLETIGTRMKYDVFKKMSEAKIIEVQLENTKFTLTESHAKMFAELLKAVPVA